MPNISRARWKADQSWMRAIGRALVGKKRLTVFLYFCNYRNMKKPDPLLVTRSADRFAALGAEPRLAILRLLLSAHPTGMIAGEVQEELEIPASTLSHHLEKLKQVGLIDVRRDGTFLWYSANTDALREVLGFLYEECCTRNRAVAPESFAQISR
jgi:DNA-binding transcriptional ArsR family regulator